MPPVWWISGGHHYLPNGSDDPSQAGYPPIFGADLLRRARALRRYLGWASAVLLWLAGACIVSCWLTAIRLF